MHREAAQAALDEVDRVTRNAGERRAQIGEQVAARSSEPCEAEKRAERLPERGLPEPELSVDRARDAEGAECGVEQQADDSFGLGGCGEQLVAAALPGLRRARALGRLAEVEEERADVAVLGPVLGDERANAVSPRVVAD